MRLLAAKKYLSVVGTTRHFPLGFEPRLVYSFLLWRNKLAKGKPTTQNRIGEFLQLDRGETIPRALVELQHAGLAATTDSGWLYVPPQGETSDYFPTNKKGEIATFSTYFPSDISPLTLRETTFYCLLWSLAWRKNEPNNDIIERQTVKGLAALLSVSRRTIDEAVEKLQAVDLIRCVQSRDGHDLAIRLFEVEPHQEDWFKGLKPVTEESVEDRYPGLFDDTRPRKAAKVTTDAQSESHKTDLVEYLEDAIIEDMKGTYVPYGREPEEEWDIGLEVDVIEEQRNGTQDDAGNQAEGGDLHPGPPASQYQQSGDCGVVTGMPGDRDRLGGQATERLPDVGVNYSSHAERARDPFLSQFE